MSAYEEGREAHDDGKRRNTDNPHSVGSTDYYDWFRGWDYEEMEEQWDSDWNDDWDDDLESAC